MIIKAIDAADHPSGRVLLLCDDAGNVLGKQVAASLEQNVESFALFTVTFAVDRETLKLA